MWPVVRIQQEPWNDLVDLDGSVPFNLLNGQVLPYGTEAVEYKVVDLVEGLIFLWNNSWKQKNLKVWMFI